MASPERTCVGCGARLPAAALVRLRLDGSAVVVDRTRSGGRGAWVHAGEACLSRAVKRKGLERAFRRVVSVDERGLRELLTGNGGKV